MCAVQAAPMPVLSTGRRDVERAWPKAALARMYYAVLDIHYALHQVMAPIAHDIIRCHVPSNELPLAVQYLKRLFWHIH